MHRKCYKRMKIPKWNSTKFGESVIYKSILMIILLICALWWDLSTKPETPSASVPIFKPKAKMQGVKQVTPSLVGPSRVYGQAVSISQDNVLIPAQQIRIGSQKFKPLSPVAFNFEDASILFTLQGLFLYLTVDKICNIISSGSL